MTRIAKLIHRIMTDIGNSVILVLKRLPMIALYTLSFFVLLTVGSNLVHRYQVAQDRHSYEAAPATRFLNYTSFIVQPAREGEDVIYTVCRNHDQNYRVDGARTLYVIPEGKSEDARVFVYNKDIKNGVIDTGNCASYYIRDRDYHFTPGSYQVTLNLCFTVKYDIKKCVNVKSNVFRIREPAVGDSDSQIQINNLKQQLDDLQQIINNLQPPVMSDATPTRSTPQTQSANSAPVATSTTPSAPQQPSQPAQNNPDPSLLERITNGILSPIRGIL